MPTCLCKDALILYPLLCARYQHNVYCCNVVFFASAKYSCNVPFEHWSTVEGLTSFRLHGLQWLLVDIGT